MSGPRVDYVDLPQLRCIWSLKYHSAILIFNNIQDLMVEKCGSLKYLFTHSITMGLALVQLQQLTIESCVMMKEIVAEEEEITIDIMIFPQLSYLCLKDLPSLARFFCKGCIEFLSLKDLIIESCQQLETFCSQSADSDVTTMIQGVEEILESNNSNSAAWQPLFNENASFPRLEELKLSDISNMREIRRSKLPEMFYCKLRRLTVERCSNLKYLLTSSIITSLEQIQEITVKSCIMMKEIVASEMREATIDTIIFPQLSYLCLQDLPNLESYYSAFNDDTTMSDGIVSASHDDTTMSDGIVEMESNETLHTAVTQPQIVNRKQVETSLYQSAGHDENYHRSIQPFFNGKAMFPGLEILELNNLDCVKTIWHNPPHEEKSFCKLKKVTLRNCANLLMIFNSAMLTRTQILNKDPLRVFCFQNLREVNVSECRSLKSLFPAPVAQTMHQLEKLNIMDCNLETLVYREKQKGVDAEMVVVTFSELKFLHLKDLPNLTTFGLGIMVPSLKEQTIEGCRQLETFFC